MVPRKKTLAKTAEKKSVSTKEKKVPSVVEKKETAVAEVAKKETAVAAVAKKETAVAEVAKKETAVAAGEKKETAVASVPKKETALAHVEKKETAVAPVQKKETALAEKKEMAAAAEKKETDVTVKKTTAKRTTKTTTKTTTAAKKTAEKKEVKTVAYVQYAGAEISIEKLEAEAKKGDLGRFAPGLPKISDGQQLFVLNGLSKLAPNGKMAIIQNGSPLFSGDAGSGPSEIRRYILENDWLDAIVQLGTDMFMNTGISTYIWICSKDKPLHRTGKVQLIDASHCYEARRKSIGTKRNDITDQCRDLIVKAYGAFENDAVYGDKEGIYCQSKIFDTEEFGYQKIVVEQPHRDENGEIVIKKGKPVADISLRDTENVPLTEDIKEYFKREVLPYAPEAWIDEKKTKKGYEIPMTRYFYEYQAPEPVEEIAVRLHELELEIQSSLDTLFGGE